MPSSASTPRKRSSRRSPGGTPSGADGLRGSSRCQHLVGDAAALVVGVGADHVPVYFTLERANARSVGPLPTVTAPAPESGERVWRWPSGIVPPDDDPAWAAFDAWLAGGRRLRGDSREGPTFRLRGEWEHPDPGELIPFEQAYAALAEFLSTGRRPTNIAWEEL